MLPPFSGLRSHQLETIEEAVTRKKLPQCEGELKTVTHNPRAGILFTILTETDNFARTNWAQVSIDSK
jgi:hypothetical protein